MTVQQLLAANASDVLSSTGEQSQEGDVAEPEALALHVSAFRMAGNCIADLLDPAAPSAGTSWQILPTPCPVTQGIL